jgi:hypothetical protein
MKPFTRIVVILFLFAGLHLIGVVFHQMFLFQHELPHLDDHSLPAPSQGETMFGSGMFLWVMHPLVAVLNASAPRFDSVLPASVVVALDSIVWAAVVLALYAVVRLILRHVDLLGAREDMQRRAVTSRDRDQNGGDADRRTAGI